MSEAEYMGDGSDYLIDEDDYECQRSTCDGCLVYNTCMIREDKDE